MRAIIITVLVAAATVTGFLLYRSSSSPAPAPDVATATSSESSALDTGCDVANAVYQYNEDQRLRLLFRRAPSAPNAGPEFASMSGRQIGNMMFVVSISSIGKEYVFTPVNSGPVTGPAYMSYVLHVRPQSGGAQMPAQLFNSEMHIIRDMPRDDSEAPRYIIMPDLMRRLYADQIDLPTGAFRFLRCERLPAPPATP